MILSFTEDIKHARQIPFYSSYLHSKAFQQDFLISQCDYYLLMIY